LFIELPNPPTPLVDTAAGADLALDAPNTLTLQALGRGMAAEAPRMKAHRARDARQWPEHCSVDAGVAAVFTFTNGS
jgi:hypothetical protein